MNETQIKQQLEQHLSDAYVHVSGDGRHFFADIVSAQFENLSKIQRHRLVYSKLKDKVGTDIHALSLRTYTQKEWEKSS